MKINHITSHEARRKTNLLDLVAMDENGDARVKDFIFSIIDGYEAAEKEIAALKEGLPYYTKEKFGIK